MLEKTLESPLDCKEIKQVNPKGNQSWIFTGRTDAKAETPIVWPSDVKNWLLGKNPNAGKDWRQEEKGTTEDEMAGWHHLLNEREFEQAPGVGDGQGSLVCCSPWACKELDMTDWLTKLNCENPRGDTDTLKFLNFTFGSLIYLGITFLYGVRCCDPIFPPMWIINNLASFIERNIIIVDIDVWFFPFHTL